MCFNFPLMPRIFIALARQSALPIVEIINQTLPIPATCDWGIFLRNHDELTLEMVTDEERDIMYTEYAKIPKMRLNLGIRRRLAPLVDNDRATLELLYALLLSIPGSPIPFIGDLPYFFTLPPHGFFWLRLVAPDEEDGIQDD